MSDIITRLLLKTNDFDANLNKAKGSVDGFQSGITNMAKSAGEGIMKFAGTIGIAIGAGEGFMKMIRSSQTTSDEFDNTLNACKGTVDVFFQSLANGDFGAFRNGILDTIRDMKELSALRDSLSDAKLSMGFNTKVFDTEFSKYESIIRDTTKSKEERERALKELQKLKHDFKVDVSDVLGGAEKELIQSLNTRSGRKDFTIPDIHKYISINNNDFSSRKDKQSLVKYQSQLKSYDKEISQIEGRINSTKGDTNEWTGETKKQMREKLLSLERQKELFKQQNSELEKQNFMNLDNDANRGVMIKNYEYAYDLKKRSYDFDKRTLELQNSLKSGGNNGGSTVEPVKDSIAWYDAEITKLNKKLINTTDTQARNAIQSSIAELEGKRMNLQVEASGNSIESINIQLSSLNKRLISETDMQARATIQATINELEQKKINLKFVVDQEAFKIAHGSMKDGALAMPIKPTYNDKVPTHGKDGKDFKLPKPESLFNKDDVNINEQYADSLEAIGSIMGSLSGVTNESAAAYLQWGANVIGSIAQAIPAIQALTTAKQTEAVVNGVASATQTPVVGWLLAGAAVASVIAAMSSIPKFATGGIVPGTSFTGDKVPALLNSGEMILNGGQQSNLFKMLNGGAYSSLGRKITPSSSNDANSANVTFRIHGRDLEGVLCNYGNQKNKVR